MRHAWWVVPLVLVSVNMDTTAAAQPAESDDYTRYEELVFDRTFGRPQRQAK